MRTLPKLLCAITLLSMSGLVWASCPEGYRENDRSGECTKIQGWVGKETKPKDEVDKKSTAQVETEVEVEECDDFICGRWRRTDGREISIIPSDGNHWDFKAVVRKVGLKDSIYGYRAGMVIARFNKVKGLQYVGEGMWRNPVFGATFTDYLITLVRENVFKADLDCYQCPGGGRSTWLRIGEPPAAVTNLEPKEITREYLESIPKAEIMERNEKALFDTSKGEFFMYIGKSRSFVEEDKQDDCEKAHMTCEFSEHQLTVVVDLPGAVARNEYGFDEGTYIGMALHLVGMPHIAETAVNAVRKLRITKPEIDIYLDPVADDEIYIAVAPDLDKLKQVLGEPKKKRGITSGSVAQSTGTGFLITRQGHVLTNSHVVDECNEIKVVTKGERVESVLVSQDSRNDIAILKIPGNFEVSASFRGGRGIRPGDEIIALGYPLQGLLSDDLKITQGIVNALAGLENDTRMMQISAPVQPGNSGGPLLDQAGNVVGIVTAKMNAVKMAEYTGDIPQNINFAIKASLARDFLDIKEIDYEISQSRDAQKLTDVFQQAKKFTVPIECW